MDSWNTQLTSAPVSLFKQAGVPRQRFHAIAEQRLSITNPAISSLWLRLFDLALMGVGCAVVLSIKTCPEPENVTQTDQ